LKYKRAFFVAFVVLISGLGLNWYASNQIDSAVQADRMPSLELFQYQWYGLLIFGFGIALFVFFIGIAVRKWIGL